MISTSRQTDQAEALQDSSTLHALSDTNRRHILTVVDQKAGLSINEIAEFGAEDAFASVRFRP